MFNVTFFSSEHLEEFGAVRIDRLSKWGRRPAAHVVPHSSTSPYDGITRHQATYSIARVDQAIKTMRRVDYARVDHTFKTMRSKLWNCFPEDWSFYCWTQWQQHGEPYSVHSLYEGSSISRQYGDERGIPGARSDSKHAKIRGSLFINSRGSRAGRWPLVLSLPK